MAKKRKKQKAKKEEEYEFTPPEFDEREFLKKEIRDTKTTLLTIGYGALFGAVAAIISMASNSLVGVSFLLVFVGIYSLKHFYAFLKIKTEEFQKKNWAGSVVWFFLTFLAVWVLAFNYPFSDHANPKVEDIVVWVTNETTGNVTAIDYVYVPSQGTYGWEPRYGSLDTLIYANAGYTVNITARVTDNGVLSSAEIAVGAVAASFESMSEEGVNRYGFEVSGANLSSETGLMFFIYALDDHGNEFTFVPAQAIPVN